jgi:hypothetical protein
MAATGDEDRTSGDSSIENHPDLSNPEWAARIERDELAGRRASKKERKKRAQPYQQERGRPRTRRLSRVSWIALFVVLAAAVAYFSVINRHSSDAYPYTPSGPVGSSGNNKPTTGAVNQDGTLDLSQPFAKTPAATWADGANGIVAPAAAPVGTWSAQQVATAEQDVRQTLIAAHLDNTMLVNHDPSAYLATLAPDARAQESAALADPSARKDLGASTRLAPGFPLLPVPIKVNGSMSASVGDHGNIQIAANYVFAYPFAPNPGTRVARPDLIVAIEHIDMNYTVVLGSTYKAADRGVWPASGSSYYDQMSCTADAAGYLGPLYSDQGVSNGTPDTEDPNALYDPNHTLNIPKGCPS